MPRRSTTAPEVSPPATTNRRTPECTRPSRDIGHRLLDSMPGGIAAVARLQSCDLIRRRTARDQDRDRRRSARSPRPARAVPPRDRRRSVRDRDAARPSSSRHSRSAAASPASNSRRGTPPARRPPRRTPLRRTRFDLAGGDQRPGKAEPDAGGADRESMIQRDAADGFQIAVEHGVDHSGAKTFGRQLGKPPANRLRTFARKRCEIDQPNSWSCSGAPAPAPGWNRASG